MTKSKLVELRGRMTRRAARGMALAVPAALILAVPAMAVTHHPKAPFTQFADCPLSNAMTEECVHATTSSGEFVVGKKTVPIKNAITLQGGTVENEVTGVQTFIGAEDGNTLSKTPQPVPGGLLGVVAPSFLPKFLQELLNEDVNKGITGVYATTELAAPASSIGISTANLLFEEGTALMLPVKVKLENAFLGSSCYIGSNAHPIMLPLTTGTTSPPAPNKPIKGKAGTLEILEENNLVKFQGNSLVNNSYAAPAVEGCGGILSLLVDPAVDAELGVPAAAGTNSAILNGTVEQAYAPAVKASE